jgi:hypothetical protein
MSLRSQTQLGNLLNGINAGGGVSATTPPVVPTVPQIGLPTINPDDLKQPLPQDVHPVPNQPWLPRVIDPTTGMTTLDTRGMPGEDIINHNVNESDIDAYDRAEFLKKYKWWLIGGGVLLLFVVMKK